MSEGTNLFSTSDERLAVHVFPNWFFSIKNLGVLFFVSEEVFHSPRPERASFKFHVCVLVISLILTMF